LGRGGSAHARKENRHQAGIRRRVRENKNFQFPGTKADIQGQRALFGSPSDPQPLPLTKSANQQAGTIQAPSCLRFGDWIIRRQIIQLPLPPVGLTRNSSKPVMHAGARLLIVAGPVRAKPTPSPAASLI